MNLRNIPLLLLLFGLAFGQEENWVEQKLRSMTIEEKVGQMFVAAYRGRFFNEEDEDFQNLVRLVRDYRIGGVMFLRGMPYEVARSLERLQRSAVLPLLVLADVEWGLSMRIDESTRFPPNMAVAATRQEHYAYEMGRVTALESRAVGVHIGFAPVLDVNNNADNVIINTRSYGEDPGLVGRFGSAFIRGMQENGLYATAKHFPGHGDTDIDSHLSLPTVSATRERVKKLELQPFKAAVDAGIKSVMTAHITYSDFPEMQGQPATLSRYFMTDVLREEMGFKGLVITDAMNMGGITRNYWSGQAAVMAINAGTDIVLMSPNPEATISFVIDAVKQNLIAEARIDASVRRILEAKLAFGLDERPLTDYDRVDRMLSNPRHLKIAEEISDASMTLVRDIDNIFPMKAEHLNKVMVLTISDDEYRPVRATMLNNEVAARVPEIIKASIDPRTTKDELKKIKDKMKDAEAVIVGIFVKLADSKGTITLPKRTVKQIKNLFKTDKPLAVVAFGSPYVIRQLPNVPSYLCAYETVSIAVASAVKAIFGEIAVTGKLPISIPGLYKMGDGLERSAYAMQLARDIDDAHLTPAYDVLIQAIADSVFPGAQLAIVRQGKLIASRGFGHHTYEAGASAVTPTTIYDIASLTKVVSTTTIAMHLWEKRTILLDLPVHNYLPNFKGTNKEQVTLRHLFAHSSGSHWWTDLWNQVSRKEQSFDYIYSLPLDFVPGDSMIYSDLGIMTAGKILETVTGSTLDQLAFDLIFERMGMFDTMFNPPAILLQRIAPTEVDKASNRGLIHGVVHDDNARFVGGVAAHAGLFSTAEDLAELAQMLLNRGMYNHHRFYSPWTVTYWTRRQNLPPGSDRALGWDTPSAKGSSAGDFFSRGSYGHLGFTGTSFWVDPNRKIAIVLLTNRVHPTRERGGMYRVRRDFHNAAMRAILYEAQ